MRDEHELLRLVGLVYECATAPEQWQVFLATFATAVDSDRPLIYFHPDRPTPGAREPVIAAVDYDMRVVEQYEEYYAARNVWLQHGRHLLQPGTVRTSEKMCPRDVLVRSEFYNDFLRVQDISHAVGATLARVESGTWNISAFRGHGRPPYEGDELSLLRALTPHLGRALEIQLRTEDLDRRVRWHEDCLDRLPVGIIFAAADAKVVFANRAARAVLDTNDGLSLDACRLRGGTPAITSLIRARIAAACGSPLGAGATLHVARGIDRRPLHVIVAPTPCNVRSLYGERGRASLFITDPERHVPVDLPYLQDHYGLTPAEARVAELLAQGLEVNAISCKLGVSVHTTRFQLKRVFDKTGTSRQSELVALLLKDTGLRST
jgi:DNA-binding CsgD family transcriptional regulator